MGIGVMALATVLLDPSSALAQSSVQDWHMLDGSRLSTVIVLDESGRETRGRLVELDPESLTLLVEGREQRFEATSVRRLAKRGDSLKNGALIGAVIGGVLGAAGSGGECSDTIVDAVAPCGAGARILGALVGSAAFAGIGVGIDALFQGQTTLYQAPGSDPGFSTGGPKIEQRSARLSGLRLHLRW